MLTCNGSKTFQTFIKAVTDLVNSNLLEDQIVCRIEKLLEKLLEKKTWLPLENRRRIQLNMHDTCYMKIL